jgi:hypothetical protein
VKKPLLWVGLTIAGLSLGASGRHSSEAKILDQIREIERRMGENDGPTLSAIDPFLRDRQDAAKGLAALIAGGERHPPTVVYFCADPDALDCPSVYADDTPHLGEILRGVERVPPGGAAGLKIKVSRELRGGRRDVYRAHMGDMHERGNAALVPVPLGRDGRVRADFSTEDGSGLVVLFAGPADGSRRFKFVWWLGPAGGPQ